MNTVEISKNAAPIPPTEQGIPTNVATPWLKVAQSCYSDLEGTYFDEEGYLWYVEASGPASKLHRVDVDSKEDIVIYEDTERRAMSSVKFGKDGRIYIPSVGPKFEKGYIFSCNRDGSDFKVVLEGPVVDDICFDSKGGIYYTHMQGSLNDPKGGVYYFNPETKETLSVMENLASPNGVALSKDEHTLWITESMAMRLTRVSLDPEGGPTDILPFGIHVPYHFNGGGACDSCEIDDDDNLYVSLHDQGRAMVFNPSGWLIGQIILAGRENGDYLGTTHTAIRPDTNELYICTNDKKNGAWIFKGEAFGKAFIR